MPKAILEFTLPEDEGQFLIATRAMQWALTVYDLDQYLRNKIKYSNHKISDINRLQAVRDELHAILGTRCLDLDMINP